MDNKTRIRICYARYPSDLERKINEFLANLEEGYIINQITFKEPLFDGEQSSYIAYIIYEPKLMYLFDWKDETSNKMFKEEEYNV